MIQSPIFSAKPGGYCKLIGEAPAVQSDLNVVVYAGIGGAVPDLEKRVELDVPVSRRLSFSFTSESMMFHASTREKERPNSSKRMA